MATIQINKTDGSIFTYELQAGETYAVGPWVSGQGNPEESDPEKMAILVSDAQGQPSQIITATRNIAVNQGLNPEDSNFPKYILSGMRAFLSWDPNSIDGTSEEELWAALMGEALANAIELAYKNDDGGTGLMQEALYWMDPAVFETVQVALADWDNDITTARADIDQKLSDACNAGQDGIRVSNLGFIACGTDTTNIGEAIIPLPEVVKANLHVSKVAITYDNVTVAPVQNQGPPI